MSKSVYQVMVIKQGSATRQTVYGPKIPTGKVAIIESLSGYLYKVYPGDYSAQKHIHVGFEHEGDKFYVNAYHQIDSGSSEQMCFAGRAIILNEGDRVLATFEGTATTTQNFVVATGWIIDVADLNK